MTLSRTERLARAWERYVAAPWQRTLAGSQRVAFVVYDKEIERSIRAQFRLFEWAAKGAGHGWTPVDCTSWFADWMAREEYREAYFEEDCLLEPKLETEFRDHCVRTLSAALEQAGENDVVAVLGVASLYGFLRVSELVRSVEPAIRGRLVVFFPGSVAGRSFRLLDARDGWNYMAVAITADDMEMPRS